VAAFDALADPTRRRVLELLAEQERGAGELASFFTISRPAVSRHLRVLREAGFVRERRQAQRRVYSLDRGGFEEVEQWLRRFWTDALDRLERHLDKEE
jgi:DNA-binding transcriptional ArsR family regulator